MVPVLATAAAGMRIGAVWQLTALVLVLVAALAAESRTTGSGPADGPKAAEPATGTAAGSGPGVTGS